MPRSRGEKDRGWSKRGHHSDRAQRLAFAIVVFVLMIGAGVGLRARNAAGDETTPAGEGTPTLPTAQQTEEALEASPPGQQEPEAETDPEAAEELPHRELDREEALELTEGVFGTVLEEPAGIFGDIEAERFLTDNAAVVTSSSLAAMSGAEGQQAEEALPPEGSVLLESSLPLRVENEEGEEEAVDLELQSAEGSGGTLVPANPITAVEVPAQLGEGVFLPVAELGIALKGAPAEQTPTNVEGDYAFYPNVATDTDLSVAPTPTGVDLMTTVRSADAPTATTYELSLPEGAEAKVGVKGSVEVLEGDRSIALIPPPSATDAAGEPVPATQQVEGDELTVTISPGPAAQFPILVDPELIAEGWDWTYNHDTLAAWTPSSNDPGYATFPYAKWEGLGGAPGLDVTSAGWGNGLVGGSAQWLYTVPRYSQDVSHGTTPSTWIYQLWTENDWFLTHGNTASYPAMIIGLADPGSSTGWWTQYAVHYGDQGDLTSASIGPFTNPPSYVAPDYGTRAAEFQLITEENETPAKYRDAYIGHASIAVVDEDAPTIKGELTAPTTWLTGPTPRAIGYSFEDAGLGVWAASVRLVGESNFKWLASFGCSGVAISPCPRSVSSTESGRPTLPFVPGELPTGEDELEVTVDDPLARAKHEVAGRVIAKVDNTEPEVTLGGALTEQEKLGTTKTEYPLTINATDGSVGSPQSGVVKAEVKVDGKLKQPWNPGCAAGHNCSFTGNWTLKTSEYTAAAHEVEVLVTDAVGNVSETTLEIDLGEAPPQTSFTSPHPSHETKEIEKVSFKATRGGAPVEGATFRCGLDLKQNESPMPCTSPFTLPEHLEDVPHTFTVAAVDKAGKADPTPATWHFETNPYPTKNVPASEKLIYPETGNKTASYYTLEAGWGANPGGKASEGVTGVTFQMQLPGYKVNEKGELISGDNGFLKTTFETVPDECVIDGQGRQVSWPLPVHAHPGHNAPVYLKVRGCAPFERAGYPEKNIQFRAVFDGSKAVAGASAPTTTEFVSRANANRVATDATESVGPTTVDLLTGAFTMSRTDVSIPVPGYEANLEFTRTYSSTGDSSLSGYSRVLGGAWQPGSPLESESEGEAWSRIVRQEIPEHEAVYEDECWNEEEEEVACAAKRCNGDQRCEEWEEEPFQPREEWIELLDTEGAAVVFEISGEGNYIAPEYAKELRLTKREGNFVLAYPNGNENIFVAGQANEWLPKYLSFQASPSSMVMVYEPLPYNQLRLVREIAPNPDPTRCQPLVSEHKIGCRTLIFEYHTFEVGHPNPASNEKLVGITYVGPNNHWAKVAEYNYQLRYTAKNSEPFEFVLGGYEKEEMLVSERNPELPTPAEAYTYDEKHLFGNLIDGVTPPGQEPWIFEYEYGDSVKPSRLKAVKRAGATTTLAYGVPTHGSAAPYPMGSEDIAKWGQTDLPVDATAIFPPNHVPAEYPPHAYTGATIHYMDPEGHEINTASPSPPGVSGASISTTETDMHGNVVRELDPQNRLIALEAGAGSATKAHELDSHSVYNANGTELLESWGPLHQVRLEATGETGVPARLHTVIRYDEGEPTPAPGVPPAYLPTKETVAAVIPGKEGEFEPKVTLTKYEWKHRLPEETIVDPGGLNIRTITKYNAAGQIIETRQPKGAAGGTAGDTRTIYYLPGGTEHCTREEYWNLPCEIVPAAQASGPGRSELPEKHFYAYNELGEPLTVSEDLRNHPGEYRATYIEYDAAGRLKSSRVVGGGTPLARTEARSEVVYSATTGLPTEQKFVCEASNCTGFEPRAVKTTYNALGQVTEYEDADHAKTKTTYDAYGRPSTVTDPKGTQTLHYDEATGLVTSMETGVGTFTASYDADGDLIRRGLPDGLTANTSYNAAGEPMKLTYTKAPETYCGGSCTWYEESLERSIGGQILYGASSLYGGTTPLVKNQYRYDKDGRLTEAQETSSENKCTARLYTFDPDSNRKTRTTRGTGVAGPCPTSGGVTTTYNYDEADRLEGPTYDIWGRITNLPESFAGGKELKTAYFANDMVARQEQNGVTNTFQLDSTGRQRQREQAGGVAGIEIFHYDGPGDSTSWTSLGSTWTRDIAGIGGELAAIQENNGTTTTTTFKLTDLHGDAVASASSSTTATKLLAVAVFSEFGEPVSGSSGRFGWLGGKTRRAELSSGVIQMGARSYIPQLGRFLTPDPIRGGSANPYDYADQDPINSLDLTGTKKKPYNRRSGAVEVGIHVYSPRNKNGRDSYGKLHTRMYIRAGSQGGGVIHVRTVKLTIERGAGSGNVEVERTIHLSNEHTGDEPKTFNNWNTGPPITYTCLNGVEYQVTLTIEYSEGMSPWHTETISAQEECNHGRY
jgi:RHS repeat-associated protein